jgi:hypothetical protein
MSRLIQKYLQSPISSAYGLCVSPSFLTKQSPKHAGTVGGLFGVSHRVHIHIGRDETGQCICPLSWSVHCNFTGEGKCNERGWACTPHPHQPELILPSSLNVRQKAAVATLCTLWCLPNGLGTWKKVCAVL